MTHVQRLALLVGCGFVLSACHAPQAPSPPSYDGAQLYRAHCATCHGRDGAGDGPMVPELRANPSDLRTLSQRNGGVFPRQAVMRQVDGRDLIAAHGTRDMPLWGWQFTRADNDRRDPGEQAAARLNALVEHLARMQVAAGR